MNNNDMFLLSNNMFVMVSETNVFIDSYVMGVL